MVSDSGVPSVTIMWASHSDDYTYTANGDWKRTGLGQRPRRHHGRLGSQHVSNPGYVFAGWSDGTAAYGAVPRTRCRAAGRP